MVQKFSKILFFADGSKGELAALRRAYSIARHHDATLTVAGVVEAVSTDDARLQSRIDKIQQVIKREKNLALDGLIASISAPGEKMLSVNKLVLAGKDYIEIIRTIKEEKFDLLVKSAHKQRDIQSVLFGNSDIRLLHYCPCPVLILKPQRKKKISKLLAAVDPGADSRQTIQLNSAIMGCAVSFAEVESADLHLLHVVESRLVDVGKTKGASQELKRLEKSLSDDAESKLNRLADGYEHLPLVEHLIKGKPEKAIPEFVKSNDIDLIIMGSVARSGVPGFFVGNTAEKILHAIDCSVLVLKPVGWKSPVS